MTKRTTAPEAFLGEKRPCALSGSPFPLGARPRKGSSRARPARFLGSLAVLALLSAAAFLAAILSPPVQKAEAAAAAVKFFNLDAAMAKAKAEGKFTVLYFWTTTCPYCRYLDTEVLTDPEVVSDLNRDFVMVSLDKDREKALSKRYRVNSVPRLVFLDSSGEPATILPGAAEPLLFRLFLSYVSTNSFQSMDFDEFIDLVTDN